MKRIAVVILVVAGLVAVSAIAFELAYQQKIYPGVTVAGKNLGNLTVAQAQQQLQSQLQPQVLTLKWGTASWDIDPQMIALQYDPQATANSAFQVGRQGGFLANSQQKFTAFTRKYSVTPVFSWQENQLVEALTNIYSQINIPAREPEITVLESQVTVSQGENGQAVNERQLQQQIRLQIGNLTFNAIDIPVTQLQPKLSSDQADQLRQRAQKLLTKKMLLQAETRQVEIDTEEILAWLDVSGWKRPEIEAWVMELSSSIDRPAQNALFKYINPGRVEEFKPAQDGLAVEQDKLVTDIIAHLSQLESGQETADIVVPLIHTTPSIKTAEVNNLGIKELIAHGQSDYTGSIPNRVFNLTKAAANFNGILIAPGETFSFNKYVGDISAAGGYKSAYIIKDGKTVLGDGGGVCQVSTTLFRAALNAGLPISERNAHAYRVHYYENDSGPGIDATIFTPSVDFKFENDTPGFILIQTSIDTTNRILSFDLYGTSDGRVATISKPKTWSTTPPPPDLFTDDPTLAPGVVKQVDFKAWGAKVSVDYKVTRGNEILQERTFFSNYRPWQAVFLRGPQV